MNEEARCVAEVIKSERLLAYGSPEQIEESRHGRRLIADAFDKYGWEEFGAFWSAVKRHLGEEEQ